MTWIPAKRGGVRGFGSKYTKSVNALCDELEKRIETGEGRHDIALALHESVVRRAAGMVKRVSTEQPIVFAGGVARNACMVRLLEEAFQGRILVPQNPQMVGALGAALLAS